MGSDVDWYELEWACQIRLAAAAAAARLAFPLAHDARAQEWDDISSMTWNHSYKCTTSSTTTLAITSTSTCRMHSALHKIMPIHHSTPLKSPNKHDCSMKVRHQKSVLTNITECWWEQDFTSKSAIHWDQRLKCWSQIEKLQASIDKTEADIFWRHRHREPSRQNNHSLRCPND